jgi:hypothetical protein
MRLRRWQLPKFGASVIDHNLTGLSRNEALQFGRAGQVTDDDIIWRMRFAFWRTKATHTHMHTLVSLVSVVFHQCSSTMGSIRLCQLTILLNKQTNLQSVAVSVTRRFYFCYRWPHDQHELFLLTQPVSTCQSKRKKQLNIYYAANEVYLLRFCLEPCIKVPALIFRFGIYETNCSKVFCLGVNLGR